MDLRSVDFLCFQAGDRIIVVPGKNFYGYQTGENVVLGFKLLEIILVILNPDFDEGVFSYRPCQ